MVALVCLTNTSVAPCIYSMAWHDTQESSREPIYLQRVHNTPSSTPAHPSFFLCQATTQDCHNRKEMWVPLFESNSLLHYKKRKRICHGPLCLPVWQPGCLGHPCDPETQRESKGESRYPTPHPSPQHCGREAWQGLQSTPAPPPAH